MVFRSNSIPVNLWQISIFYQSGPSRFHPSSDQLKSSDTVSAPDAQLLQESHLWMSGEG